MTRARYDGQTEWYESFASNDVFAEARAAAVELLGGGSGRCLDLGCGTGLAVPLLVEAGWSVIATDVSGDQLEAARCRVGALADRLLQADAHELPFADGAFDAVISILTHTDLDDVDKAFGEAHRILRTNGTFVYLGVHPCFASPFVERGGLEHPILRPGYRDAGWKRLPGDEGSDRIRARVGINHLPLAGLVNAVVGSGFTIESVEEPGETDPPLFLTFRSTKP